MDRRSRKMNLVFVTVAAIHVLCWLFPCTEAKPQQQQQKHQIQNPTDLLGAETSVAGSSTDLAAAATNDGKGGEKFFMYAHQPDKKEYEFGFKRGNGYHTIERYEKGGPHHNFKTKVRWQDSKGGHGEHYWDYNHAPKYHDDHHDDHHGGDGHGYSDDHHGDHGGYHSQPIPEFIPAASQNLGATAAGISPAVQAKSTTPFIGKREGIVRPSKEYESTDTYRPKKKATKKPKNKVGVDKDSGQDKKNNKQFHTYSEKKTFEYKSSSIPDAKEIDKAESPSAFPELLGFDPYLPPAISSENYYPGSFFPEQEGSSSNQPAFPSMFDEEESLRHTSSAKDNQAAESIVSPQVSPALPALSTLSFDLETGRIYDETTGVWYALVPFEDVEEE